MTSDHTTSYEPLGVKTGLWGFQQGQTQTGLYSHRRWLEKMARNSNFVLQKNREFTIHVAKTMVAQISCAVQCSYCTHTPWARRAYHAPP